MIRQKVDFVIKQVQFNLNSRSPSSACLDYTVGNDEYILQRNQSRKTLLSLQSCVGFKVAATFSIEIWIIVFVFFLILEWKTHQWIIIQS